MDTLQKQKIISQIKQRFELIKPHLSEREIRLWVAAESIVIGHGGDTLVQEATGVSRVTICSGRKDIKNEPVGQKDRLLGGGRKSLIEKDPALIQTLDGLIYPLSREESENPTLRWTRKSTAVLAKALNLAPGLESKGYKVSQKTVYSILKTMGYSLYSNKKRVSKDVGYAMDMQFHFIYERVKSYQSRGLPVISIDIRKTGTLICTDGSSETFQTEKWGPIQIDPGTALFAATSIQKWLNDLGHTVYPDTPGLLITVDCDGNSIWKQGIQMLANDLGIAIEVCHFPSGIRKWHKIENQIENCFVQGLQRFSVIINHIANEMLKSEMNLDGQNANDLGTDFKSGFILNQWNYVMISKK